ncbi:damage-inducible protein DinB [Rhodophyticola sp. CCM32]|nr:damage-inducible protein DinB [Rhodophyticola sp. CCM32]
MARYNIWQNENLFGAADMLDDAARRQDRGAFFGSIQGTFSHLLWSDLSWMSRFDDGPAPDCGINDSAGFFDDWSALKRDRKATDARIEGWAARLDPDDLTGDLVWFSGMTGREMRKPRALCIMQLFNHQTHHRGQVHAMLTAAGADPGSTDLPFMPDVI